MHQKYSIGLVIGRFQPFHKGHKYLIKKALHVSKNIKIAIGSSNVNDLDNPYDFETRKAMLELFLEKEGLRDKVISIFPSPDIPDDGKWLEDILKRAGTFDVVIGNNDWVNGIFEDAKYKVLVISHYKRNILEGKKIRQLMREGKTWEKRVPHYLKKNIPSIG